MTTNEGRVRPVIVRIPLGVKRCSFVMAKDGRTKRQVIRSLFIVFTWRPRLHPQLPRAHGFDIKVRYRRGH